MNAVACEDAHEQTIKLCMQKHDDNTNNNDNNRDTNDNI